MGKTIDIETDHKPLVPLLSSKDLDAMPPRILRFHLRMMRYSFNICYVPGKLLYVTDTLSRAPVMSKSDVDDAEDLEGATEAFIASVVSYLPAIPTRLNQLRNAQSEDETLQTVFKYCEQGWPTKNSLSGNLKPYWSVKDELTIHNGSLLRASRIVVPSSLQEEILQKLHEGHQGIVKTQLRVRTSVWWPGVSRQIQRFIQNCNTCCKSFQTQTEPLIPTELPSRPWQKLGSDLFEYKGATYILVVDYFSRYVEILRLSISTSASIIAIPEI